MKKFIELFEQQDGSACALNAAIVLGFVVFWLAWIIVSIANKTICDIPTNVWLLLSVMLGAKVGKDYVDYAKGQQTSQS